MNTKPLLHLVTAGALCCFTGCVVVDNPQRRAVSQRPGAVAQEGGPQDPQGPGDAPGATTTEVTQVERPAPTDTELHQELDGLGRWTEEDGVRCWIPGPEVTAAAPQLADAGTHSGQSPSNAGDVPATNPASSGGGNGNNPGDPATADPAAAPQYRPYTNGQWVQTDAGLSWQSNDPGGDTTSHFGNWYLSPTYHCYVWRPGVVWAPAWVSWNEGAVYSGWAPLPPVGVAVVVEPSAYVFVDRRFVTSARIYEHVYASRENYRIYSTTHVVGRTTIVNGHATTHQISSAIRREHPGTRFPEKRSSHAVAGHQTGTHAKSVTGHNTAHPNNLSHPSGTSAKPVHTQPPKRVPDPPVVKKNNK